jgi:hypothetical protein
MAWITPRTDWMPGDGFMARDLNRIEGNIATLPRIYHLNGGSNFLLLLDANSQIGIISARQLAYDVRDYMGGTAPLVGTLWLRVRPVNRSTPESYQNPTPPIFGSPLVETSLATIGAPMKRDLDDPLVVATAPVTGLYMVSIYDANTSRTFDFAMADVDILVVPPNA